MSGPNYEMDDDGDDDEFGDPSFLMDVDLDGIASEAAANSKAPPAPPVIPPSTHHQSDESPTTKRRKISLSPNNNNSADAALEETLSSYFGYSKFRAGQLDAIQALVTEQRDVAVFQSTGSGKSLCYQIPALHTQKVVIVVSPLISLMQDQVHKLNGLLFFPNDSSKGSNSSSSSSSGVATFLGSGQTDTTQEQAALNGDFALVYLTPEKLLSGNFLRALATMHQTKREILAFAIDEAHCISEWGVDFRPEFGQLGMLRSSDAPACLKQIPIMALTATAVPRVQKDILKQLNLNNPKVIKHSFDRNNLIISVRKKDRNMPLESAMQPLINSLFKTPESTIVYASTRNQVEEIASFLKQRLEQKDKDIVVQAYHAGLSLNERNDAHTNFLTSKTKVIVATVAFGMGIDKIDTRRVIHWGPPKTVEEYYQQIGRAGRDGLQAECTMFVSEGDFDKYKSDFYVGNLKGSAKEAVLQSIASLKSYSLDTTKCRRLMLLEFFEETPSFGKRCGTCDTCQKYANLDEKDLERDFGPMGARVVLQAVEALNGEQGITTIVSVVSGKTVEQYRYKRGITDSRVKEQVLERKEELSKKLSQDSYRELIVPLTQQGYLKESSKSTTVNGYSRSWTTYALTHKGSTALFDKSVPITLPVPESFREAERLEKARREKVMTQLQENGIDLDKLPPEEVEAGDGEVIRAFSKWTSYLESKRKHGNDDRAIQLETLQQNMEKWRAEAAIKHRMAPSTVLAEHTLVKIAYTAATMTPGMKLAESDLVSAGVRTREIESLCQVLGQWVDEHQPAVGDVQNETVEEIMQLEPGKLVTGNAWEYAVYKPVKKTGLASWESSYNRFQAGESPQTIAISPENGKPIQARTVCGHIQSALLYGKGVDLHRLAQFLPAPKRSEWEQLQAAELSAGVDVCGNPVSCGVDGAKLLKGDLLRPILGDELIDTPYNERSEDDKAKLGFWFEKLDWYMTLRRIGYKPSFGAL